MLLANPVGGDWFLEKALEAGGGYRTVTGAGPTLARETKVVGEMTRSLGPSSFPSILSMRLAVIAPPAGLRRLSLVRLCDRRVMSMIVRKEHVLTKSGLVVALLLLGLAVQSASGADGGLGSIKDLAGAPSIDAFGKGVFLPAIRGDALYPQTTIRTGANDRVTILLQGETVDLPPSATIRIADLVSSASRKKGQNWFKALGDLFRAVSAPGRGGDEQVLGSRAADMAAQEQGDAWHVEEDDPAALLADAQRLIHDQEYGKALGRLDAIGTVDDENLRWDVAFWRGFAYFQAGDYADAKLSLSSALARSRAAGAELGTPATRRTLLFQLGASEYFLGNDQAAIPLLEIVRADERGDDYDPYATLLLAKALTKAGQAAKARSIAQEAKSRYSATPLEKEFAELAGGP